MAFFPGVLRKLLQKKFDFASDYEQVIFIDVFLIKNTYKQNFGWLESESLMNQLFNLWT